MDIPMPSWCSFFWFFRETAFILVVAGKKHCCLPKTFLLQMIKNSEDERKPTNLLQVTVMPQLINWKQVDWHPVWIVWTLELHLSYHSTVTRTLKEQPKLSKTGVRVKTLLYREETLLPREETPLYWFKAPSPKLLCHAGPSTSISFSTELLWLNVCLKKHLVQTSSISKRNSWGIWMSLHNGTVLKTNNGCGWQKYAKMKKKVREQNWRSVGQKSSSGRKSRN